jgi:carotenoid cleavage dioxygenase-like enzyme
MAEDNKADGSAMDRRRFLGAAGLGAGVAATAGLATAAPANAEVLFPAERSAFGGGGSVGGGVYRSENDLYDCEVEGKLPADLDGAFYRIGPDPQYPKPAQFAGDIPFDGEGMVSMFRIKGGHVDFKSRYVKTQRWKAQHAARRSLFGMYRNPFTDDPSVKGLSRGTANTQLFYHHGKILAFKEDSPPVAMDPITLETTDDYYLFGGRYEGLTHTAHPKIDSETGEMIGFGYEAKGLNSDQVYVYSCDPKGKLTWSTFIKVPYVGMIHDFGVTQKHIVFFVTPMATNMEAIKAGKVHFAWDSTMPTYMGVMRRHGDGKDLRWFKGPTMMCTHTMGNWSDGEKVYVDMDGGDGNQFPFFPSVHEPFDPVKAVGRVRRFTMDLSSKSNDAYEFKIMYPHITGQLSRQDDRYLTVPYRYGFLQGGDTTTGAQGWVAIDHQMGTAKTFSLGPDAKLAEMTFVPRNKAAGEADGYLIGVATYAKENGRADLILADTRDLGAGPIAKVKLPYRVHSQVHGFWVAGHQLPPEPVPQMPKPHLS